jgi:hypothetical protein
MRTSPLTSDVGDGTDALPLAGDGVGLLKVSVPEGGDWLVGVGTVLVGATERGTLMVIVSSGSTVTCNVIDS